MKTIFTFKDNWTIQQLETEEDRARQKELAHDKHSICISGYSWQERLDSGKYYLMGLYDPEGNPHATILMADADFVIQARAGIDYHAYTSAQIFDQFPREFDGKRFITLECIPKNYPSVSGDKRIEREETKKIQSWYEEQPIPEIYQSYRANDSNMRTAAQEFLRHK